jgi:hypothetical protein
MDDEQNKFSPHPPKSRISPAQAALLAAAIVIAIPLVFVIVLAYGISHTVTDQDVAGATRISSDWIELVPNRPLKSTQSTQSLILEVSPNGAGNNESDLPLPQVELIDEYRNTYRLKSFAQDSTRMLFGSELIPLPRDRVYPKVRLRSDKPFQCARIVWRNEDHK